MAPFCGIGTVQAICSLKDCIFNTSLFSQYLIYVSCCWAVPFWNFALRKSGIHWHNVPTPKFRHRTDAIIWRKKTFSFWNCDTRGKRKSSMSQCCNSRFFFHVCFFNDWWFIWCPFQPCVPLLFSHYNTSGHGNICKYVVILTKMRTTEDSCLKQSCTPKPWHIVPCLLLPIALSILTLTTAMSDTRKKN